MLSIFFPSIVWNGNFLTVVNVRGMRRRSLASARVGIAVKLQPYKPFGGRVSLQKHLDHLRELPWTDTMDD